MADRFMTLRARYSTVIIGVKFTFYVDQIAVSWAIRILVNTHRKGIQMEKRPLRTVILMNGEATTGAPG